MKKVFNNASLFFLSAISISLYCIAGHPNSIFFCLLFSLVSCLVIVSSYKKSIEISSAISFFSIANLFAGFIFVIRPVYLLIQGNMLLFPAQLYHNVHRVYLEYGDLPWAKASLIGMLGIIFLNLPILFSGKDMKLKILSIRASEYKFRNNQNIALALIAIFGLANAAVFYIRRTQGLSIHIYNLVWVFIFASLLLYIISRKRRADFSSYVLIGLAVMFLSLIGRRQYIVNLLICYMIPLYFTGKNRKKTYALLSLFVLATLFIVRIYAEIRGSGQRDLFSGVIGEFSMFDMLMVTDVDFNLNGIGLFWGYNYLNIFTIPIPRIHIRPFDHLVTDIVFNNMFNGGIPTSLFGSLYFNFSYIGVCLGSLVLGMILLKAQKKFSTDMSYESIGYYSIFATFVYDIIRVGDVGREFWSCMTFIIVYSFFIFFMRKIRNDTIVLKSAS